MLNFKNIFSGLFGYKPTTQSPVTTGTSTNNAFNVSPGSTNNISYTGTGIQALQQQMLAQQSMHVPNSAANVVANQIQYRPGAFYPHGLFSIRNRRPIMRSDGTIGTEFHINIDEEFTQFKECFDNSEEFRTEVKTFMSSKTFNDDLKALIEEPKDE